MGKIPNLKLKLTKWMQILRYFSLLKIKKEEITIAWYIAKMPGEVILV